MNFRTIQNKPEFPFKIDYTNSCMFVGSCFAENIGQRMADLKFMTNINPFGILYNPVSVKNAFSKILSTSKFAQRDVVKHNGLWHSLLHHGCFSNSDIDVCLSNINNKVEEARSFLDKTNLLFITFGSAWVYEYIETKQIVGNCHKIPASKFRKYLLDVQEITDEYRKLIPRLQSCNKDLKIILTISPVRYLADGLHENNLSKSTLHLAVNQITKQFDNVFYFPAYEMLIDDLRDYRFYAEDMTHPSKIAVDYIFDAFSNSFFNERTKNTISEIRKIIKATKHRFIHKATDENKKFITKTLNKIETISEKNPNLDFQNEIKYFKNIS